MTARNMERLAAERRMRKRGFEHVSDTGFTVDLVARLKRSKANAEAFIALARTYKPVEDVAEAARHVPDAKLGGRTRAQVDDWLRGIVDSAED